MDAKKSQTTEKQSGGRGFDPGDGRFFSPEAVATLKRAARQIQYLLDEGYAVKPASTFVGNHYLLSQRQRLALMRVLAPSDRIRSRRDRCVARKDLAGRTVCVDGFNIVITLETALCGSVLFLGKDGAVRDLAGLRGTYRVIPETRRAVEIMLHHLAAAHVRETVVYLDEPVSNSGRLKALMAGVWEAMNAEPAAGGEAAASAGSAMTLDIRIARNVDRLLMAEPLVITADSVILDACSRWYNLTAGCLCETGASPLVLFDSEK